MKILILGSGGREHALALCLLKDPGVEKVVIAPGNQAMELTASITTWTDLCAQDLTAIAARAKEQSIDFTIIGAEQFAYANAVGIWREFGLKILGPTPSASQLESSKIFAKKMLNQLNIATAQWQEFTHFQQLATWARNLPDQHITHWVIKTDGPQLGKGVFLPQNREQLEESLGFLGQLKNEKFLIEKTLSGVEISSFALISGQQVLYLGDATDYKRAYNDNQGPNTGGMGSIAPSPYLEASERQWIQEKVFAPAAQAMHQRGTPFYGFLFAGLIKTNQALHVLEFNVRMGDPETQSLTQLWPTDTATRLQQCLGGRFPDCWPLAQDKMAMHVVVAAPNYPGLSSPVQMGLEFPIEAFARNPDGPVLIAAGLERGPNAKWANRSGRVLGLSASGHNRRDMRQKIYTELSKDIYCQGFWRTDIGVINQHDQ